MAPSASYATFDFDIWSDRHPQPGAVALRDGMHDWVVANEDMAKVLAARGYHYQFVFARNAGHVDRTVKLETLPEALEYVWRGYPMQRVGK